jgi:hypothetical protein
VATTDDAAGDCGLVQWSGFWTGAGYWAMQFSCMIRQMFCPTGELANDHHWLAQP